MTLILIISCNTKSEKKQNEIETRTQNENSIKRFNSISAIELEKLINVPIRNKFGEKYSGFYTFTTDEKGQKVLNGNFEFKYSDRSAMYNEALDEYDSTWITESYIKYEGSFLKGKRNGIFTEKLLFDDGLDLYSKWLISLEFVNDNCTNGTFTGIFGHVMSESTYKFEKLNTCTFQTVVDKASERWKEEYEKREN